MYKLMGFWSPVKLFSFAEDGAGGGDNDGNKDMVTKADLEAAVAEKDRLAKDLEEMRLEVLSPEYMQFLQNKGDGTVKKPEAKPEELTEDKLEKMSKKELLAFAEKNAKDALKKEMDDLKAESKKDRDSRSAREIAAFAEAHDDYETFRPIMHGFSLDPKHSNKPLSSLYNLAKEYVGRVQKKPTEEEIAAKKKLSTEKPGGSTDSYEDLRKLNTKDATAKAMEEVKDKLGSFPTV